ncbi:MAG TPA: ABC transporter permease [Waddliaceae bacterium]
MEPANWSIIFTNAPTMFKNYFKTAWRSFRKNKTFSILNTIGLSIGMACFLLIMLFVLDESSYDRYNVHADLIYRVDDHIKFGDFLYNGAETPAVMGPSFAKEFHQIQQYTRLKNNGGLILSKGSDHIREDHVIYADSSIFKVFTLPMIAGDPENSLKEPYSMVITASMAKKYFNNTNPLGKTLLANDKDSYKITGIIKDIPQESHFSSDFLLPVSMLDQSRDNSWFNANFHTYLLLKKGTDVKNLERQLNKQIYASSSPQFKTMLNMSQDDFMKADDFLNCSLMPLTKIHLYSSIQNELENNGSIQYVYIFSTIAVFILLIACINFMNLSTAHSSNRAREVGMRKVLGAVKGDLIAQFLSESFLLSLISFVLAVALVCLLLPLFNQLADKHISLSTLFNPYIMVAISLLSVVVGLLAGSYPAFFLSSFQPINVLNGKVAKGFKGSVLRSSLVAFQFTISMVLMLATLVIYEQLNYIQHKNIGFNKEQILVLSNTYALDKNTNAFRNELLQMPGVEKVTVTSFLPVVGGRGSSGFVASPSFDGKNFTLMQQWSVDENYIPTLQLQLQSGRNFSKQFGLDSAGVVINEAAAKYLGSNPINKKIYRIDDLSTGKLKAYTVIGVIKNFNFNSLHEEVAPLVLKLQADNGSMAVRVNTGDISGLIAQVRSKWKIMAPSQPFSYSFLDDEFNKQYNAELRTGKISITFSILAILIACLGLFGLVTYAAEQRIKEIGIRKILGAAFFDIVGMLSRDFIKLIFLSACIASPIAWWAMTRWLQGYAYRIDITWWMFVLVGFVALIIALATVSFQAIKSATANPIKSLRAE